MWADRGHLVRLSAKRERDFGGTTNREAERAAHAGGPGCPRSGGFLLCGGPAFGHQAQGLWIKAVLELQHALRKRLFGVAFDDRH